MKYKHVARAAGAFNTLIFSACTYLAVGYTLVVPDIPLYQRAISGALASASSIGAIDGIVDIVKGTHHYFTVALSKHAATITGNKQEARRIESALEDMLEYREQNHDLLPRFMRKK